jgi:hypothetical protein
LQTIGALNVSDRPADAVAALVLESTAARVDGSTPPRGDGSLLPKRLR